MASRVRRWRETRHRAAIRMTVRTGYRETGSVRDLERFRAAVGAWAAGGTNAPADVVVGGALTGEGLATVVLVEGISDQHAVEALAVRQHRDLADEGICVVPIG